MSKNKNVKKKEKKPNKKPPSRGNILSFVQIVIAIVAVLIGIRTIMVTKDISKTANLLYIQSDIQNRTDAVLSITDKLDSYNELFPNPSEEERKQIREIKNMKKDAIIALLRAYEFACRQYIKRNVDRREFKDLYGDGTLGYILDEYKDNIRDHECPSIRKVNEMWQ